MNTEQPRFLTSLQTVQPAWFGALVGNGSRLNSVGGRYRRVMKLCRWPGKDRGGQKDQGTVGLEYER